MINLYQEQIPFSNKVLDKSISMNGAYTNPVIMPFALDFTAYNNSLETVMYIRNDAVDKYYKNVVVSLMTAPLNSSEAPSTGTITYTDVYSTFNLNGTDHSATVAQISTTVVPTGTAVVTGMYKAGYNLVDTGDLTVRFSWGYSELSGAMWATKRPVLVIPSLGVPGAPNTQYIPIRMRMSWRQNPPTMLTIRDYFIDISYGSELRVTG
jgi:hypothetical protein